MSGKSYQRTQSRRVERNICVQPSEAGGVSGLRLSLTIDFIYERVGY